MQMGALRLGFSLEPLTDGRGSEIGSSCLHKLTVPDRKGMGQPDKISPIPLSTRSS